MCSSIGADTTARNKWCHDANSGFTYDTTNANEVCADTPCADTEPTDVALCCLDPSKAKCRTIWDAAKSATTPDATFCDNNNKAYDPAKANDYCAAVGVDAACSKDPDANTCCGTKATCVSIKTQANWCGTGKVYKGSADSTACASTTCTATDVSTCCVAQCSTIATTGGFCGSQVYDSSKASNACAASACSSGLPADVTACCKTPESDSDSGGSGEGGAAGPGSLLARAPAAPSARRVTVTGGSDHS